MIYIFGRRLVKVRLSICDYEFKTVKAVFARILRNHKLDLREGKIGLSDLKLIVIRLKRVGGRFKLSFFRFPKLFFFVVSDLRKINVYGDVAHQPLCSYYGKLNELPQALFENGFLRVGRSAVVNMKYIRQISSYMVTLRNGVKLGVSRNGYAEIRSTYLEWKGQFGDD